jgi:HEAT repeat protein
LAGPTRDEGPGRAVREAVRRLRDLTSAEAPTGDERQAGIEEVGHALRAVAGEHGDIELVVGTNRITFGDDAVYKSDARENNLAFELFRQGLRRITFRSGLTDEEIETFVRHFAECREIEKVDEDFVSTLWRESMPGVHYVAIDGFTEKIFMADEAFTSTFRAVIDDVCPGLLEMAEEDEADLQPRPRQVLDAGPGVSAGLDQLRATSKALATTGSRLRTQMRAAQEGALPLEHLLELLAAVAVKSPCALPDDEAGHALLTTLDAFYAGHGPQAFADAARTVLAVTDPLVGAQTPQGERVRAVRAVIAGRPALGMVARHYVSDRPEVTAWLRWYFVTAGALSAPDLLGLINTTPAGPALDFLKDLLRRQGTSSLEPWAERLRDDNPGVVLEVLEVILGSELGDQAQPLLLELLRHPVPEVRARAIDGLRGAYSQPLRQALLPLLRDPSPAVRRAVMSRFALAGDATVSTYVAATIKSPMFLEFDEDEQRQFFESLSLLGGERFIEVYRERLNLEEAQQTGLGRLLRRGGGTLYDTTIRRAALAGLGLLASPPAIALIRECHAKADLELAAQCDVALRMATRGGGERPKAVPVAAHVPSGEDSAAVVAAGADKLGARTLFEAAPFSVEPPPKPRHIAPVSTRPPETLEPLRGAGPTGPLPAIPQARAQLSFSELPLLADGEVFLPDDERRLRAEPGQSEDGRFVLTSPRAALIGVPAQAVSEVPVAAATAIPATPPRSAPRVVEKTARPATHSDWTHQPDATLADILSSYLDEEEAARASAKPAAPSAPPPPPEPPPRPARPATAPLPPPAARPATAPLPPPPAARPATAPLPPPPPPPAPQAGGEAPKPAAIDDMLKEFLDMDLGD